MSTSARCKKCGQQFPQSEIFKHFLQCQHKSEETQKAQEIAQKQQIEQPKLGNEDVKPVVEQRSRPKIQEIEQPKPQIIEQIQQEKCQYCNENKHPQDCELKKQITQLITEDKQPLEVQQYRKCITIANKMNLWLDSLVGQDVLSVYKAQKNEQEQPCQICNSGIGKEEFQLQFITCKHQFHSNCLVTSLLKILNSGDQQVTCPQCMY